MKVLASHRLPGPAFAELTDLELLPTQIPDGIGGVRSDVEALAVEHEVVDDRALDLLPALRLVANYGVGYDEIDVAACAARGVAVTNTPGVLDDATADLAFALLLATQRGVVKGDALIRAGEWSTGPDPFMSPEVSGATLGIVGFGRIGQAMARRAQPFKMRTLYHKRNRLPTDEERILGVHYRPLDDLLAEADIVSIHVPLRDDTRDLIDARRLALLRPGACLINTARGPIVTQDALVDAVVAGGISAGLDVFDDEPDVPASLLTLPNVVLTPHIGSATHRTREAMTRLMVDNLLAAADGRPLLTPVPVPA